MRNIKRNRVVSIIWMQPEKLFIERENDAQEHVFK